MSYKRKRADEPVEDEDEEESVPDDDPKRPRNRASGTEEDVDKLFVREDQRRFFRDLFGTKVQIPLTAPTLETMKRDADGAFIPLKGSAAGLYAFPPDAGRTVRDDTAKGSAGKSPGVFEMWE